MAESIQDQIAATGFAQVIVVLKGAEGGGAPPGPASAGLVLESLGLGSGLGSGAATLRQIASELERVFIRTSETRDGASPWLPHCAARMPRSSAS